MPVALKVMVLAGGPDRERPVSLKSGAAVKQALRDAGHQAIQCDINPQDLSALEKWRQWGGDVVFPVLHGPWGEGGPLQRILDEQSIPFVGCRSESANLCMDKYLTKTALTRHSLPTPPFELITHNQKPTLSPPLVIKPQREGSSLDLTICPTEQLAFLAHARLSNYEATLVEKFIAGKELTVGVIASNDDHEQTLPPIWIVPNREYYDYQAKYERNDTKYFLDPRQIELPESVMNHLGDLAVTAHRLLGCRHMSRVDFIVDASNQPWILEVNTVPGFTSHSLLPKAAAYAGLSLQNLVDRLVRLAVCHTG